jgi:hypothetical protein
MGRHHDADINRVPADLFNKIFLGKDADKYPDFFSRNGRVVETCYDEYKQNEDKRIRAMHWLFFSWALMYK